MSSFYSAAVRGLCGRAPAALLMLTLLAGCGGGGGGGGGGGTPAPPAGGFTVSTSSLSFSGKFVAAPPLPQSVLVTLADSTSAAVGAGYKPGITPATWLTINVTGTAPNFSFAFFANTTTLPAGTYSTTVTIGTSNTNGDILQTRDVQVTYTVREGLTISSTPPLLTAVAGTASGIQTFQVAVTAPGNIQWRATSSQPWLLPPAGTLTGSGTHSVGVDASALPVGATSANLTLTNVADSTDTATLLVSINVTVPALTTNVQNIRLGGESGLDGTPATLRFSLETGTNAHPWTIVASTTSGGDWLEVDNASGTVSATESTVAVSADRSQLAAGSYSGELVVQATVNGSAITKTVTVQLRVEANHLVVSATGVGFSKFPSHEVLTRALVVRQSADEPAIPWQATSNATWLAVTPSGMTGDALVLTANPSALASDQLHEAEVSIVSTSPRATNVEKVRVGLTARSVDPPAQADVSGLFSLWTAANPVEPEVFVVVFDNGSTKVAVYDIYSGALLRTLATATGAQALAMSGDGRTLYVAQDTPNGAQVARLDPVTGDPLGPAFDLQKPLIGMDFGMAYSRPDSHGVLLTTYQTFDAASAQNYGSFFEDGASIVTSSDQRYVYTQNQGTTARIHRYELRYGSLAPVPLLRELLATNDGHETSYTRDGGRDLALSADDAVVYTAAGFPPQFDKLAADSLQLVEPALAGVPGTDNVETCWNGLIAAGADNSSAAHDLWIYDADGTERAQRDSGNDALFAGSVRFSPDCTRIVSSSGSGLRFHAVP